MTPSPKTEFQQSAAKHNGFASELFTIIAGPSKGELHVPKDILTEVPYFEGALRSGRFSESHNKTFILPDDDPDAISEVFYSSYGDQVSKASKLPELYSTSPYTHEERSKVYALVKAYITADKLMAFKAKNIFYEELVLYHRSRLVDPRNITLLSRSDLVQSSLFVFLICELATRFNTENQSQIFAWQAFDLRMPWFEEARQEMSREDLFWLLDAIDAMKGCNPPPSRSLMWRNGADIEEVFKQDADGQVLEAEEPYLHDPSTILHRLRQYCRGVRGSISEIGRDD
ncbi:hypothetical protein OHC33_000654 [Knufia fluminis]|uniref:BTB domain-containing protein n=1 Tax=Knufia fluminis TaxID=191047 RepID=A0AAN8FHJ6_9EURO|nr:hypothetical protein OHC33_000654 [Knufia fluminis]